MVGPNRSIHHLDSMSVPVAMIAAGLWGKCNWEIWQDCWALCIETWTHFALIRIFLLRHITTPVVIGTVINHNLSCVLTGLKGLWLYLLAMAVTYCCSWLIVCYAVKEMKQDILIRFWIEAI